MIFRKKPKTEQVIMATVEIAMKQHILFLRQCSEDPEMREITGQQACLELAASGACVAAIGAIGVLSVFMVWLEHYLGGYALVVLAGMVVLAGAIGVGLSA